MLAGTEATDDELFDEVEQALEAQGLLAPRNLRGFVQQAQQELEIGQPVPEGALIPMAEEEGAWGNLILSESLNLWTALPKTGKTALICHVFACSKRGDEKCLGLPMTYRWNKMILSGADMDLKQWAKIFLREGLGTYVEGTDDSTPQLKMGSDVLLWPSESPLNFSTPGLKRLREYCEKFPGSLVVIDDLRNHVPSTWKEIDGQAGAVLRNLKKALVGTKSTVVIIHHSSKSNSGRGAIQAASGGTAITGAVDCALSLRFLTDEDDAFRTDRRVVLSTAARAEAGAHMVELTGGGLGKWEDRGDPREVVRQEKIWAIEERLTNRQRAVYEYAEEIAENGVHLTTKEAMVTCNLTRQQAVKTIAQLVRKGLLKKCGELTAGPAGGRPKTLYAPVLSELASSPSDGVQRVQGVQTSCSRDDSFSENGVLGVLGVQTSSMSIGDRVSYKGRPDFLVKAVDRGRVNIQHVSTLETHSNLLPGVDVFDADVAMLSEAPLRGDEGEGEGVSVSEQIDTSKQETAKQPAESTSIASPSARSSCSTAEQPTASGQEDLLSGIPEGSSEPLDFNDFDF